MGNIIFDFEGAIQQISYHSKDVYDIKSPPKYSDKVQHVEYNICMATRNIICQFNTIQFQGICFSLKLMIELLQNQLSFISYLCRLNCYNINWFISYVCRLNSTYVILKETALELQWMWKSCSVMLLPAVWVTLLQWRTTMDLSRVQIMKKKYSFILGKDLSKISLYMSSIALWLLAHMSRRLKWALPIPLRPSSFVRVSFVRAFVWR